MWHVLIIRRRGVVCTCKRGVACGPHVQVHHTPSCGCAVVLPHPGMTAAAPHSVERPMCAGNVAQMCIV